MFRLLIPTNASGAIIGKSGRTVKQISEDSGAQVKLSAPEETAGSIPERIVSFTGNREQVLQAAIQTFDILAGELRNLMYSIPGVAYTASPPVYHGAAVGGYSSLSYSGAPSGPHHPPHSGYYSTPGGQRYSHQAGPPPPQSYGGSYYGPPQPYGGPLPAYPPAPPWAAGGGGYTSAYPPPPSSHYPGPAVYGGPPPYGASGPLPPPAPGSQPYYYTHTGGPVPMPPHFSAGAPPPSAFADGGRQHEAPPPYHVPQHSRHRAPSSSSSSHAHTEAGYGYHGTDLPAVNDSASNEDEEPTDEYAAHAATGLLGDGGGSGGGKQPYPPPVDAEAAAALEAVLGSSPAHTSALSVHSSRSLLSAASTSNSSLSGGTVASHHSGGGGSFGPSSRTHLGASGRSAASSVRSVGAGSGLLPVAEHYPTAAAGTAEQYYSLAPPASSSHPYSGGPPVGYSYARPPALHHHSEHFLSSSAAPLSQQLHDEPRHYHAHLLDSAAKEAAYAHGGGHRGVSDTALVRPQDAVSSGFMRSLLARTGAFGAGFGPLPGGGGKVEAAAAAGGTASGSMWRSGQAAGTGLAPAGAGTGLSARAAAADSGFDDAAGEADWRRSADDPTSSFSTSSAAAGRASGSGFGAGTGLGLGFGRGPEPAPASMPDGRPAAARPAGRGLAEELFRANQLLGAGDSLQTTATSVGRVVAGGFGGAPSHQPLSRPPSHADEAARLMEQLSVTTAEPGVGASWQWE